MKYYIYAIIIFFFLPWFTFGQTVTNAEDYLIGDEIVWQECDTTGMKIPSSNRPISGWDYSGLKSLSTQYKIQILDTGTKYGKLFPTSDFIEKDSYGNYYFIKKYADANYMIGSYFSNGGTKYYYTDPIIDSYRKLSVGKTISDNHRDSSVYTKGGGTVEMSVIGKNTLILPTRTYYNVLLLKTTLYSADSQWNSQPFPPSTSESYRWYDGIHPAPLLQILFSQTGSSNYNNVMYLVSEKYTPVEEITYSKKMSLYPNPTNSNINIVTPVEGNLSIVNNLGQTVNTIQLKENTTTVSLSELPCGVYFVSFNTMGVVETQKLVITR